MCVNDATGGYAQENCAHCTAAGCLRLLNGPQMTSGDVNADRMGEGARDEQEATDWCEGIGDVDGQVTNLSEWIEGKTGRAAARKEFDTMAAVETWMRNQPDGTVFAVLTAPSQITLGGVRPHWVCAQRNGDTLRYSDYQQNTAGSSGPYISNVPLAPDGQNAPAASRMLAIAFLEGGTSSGSDSD